MKALRFLNSTRSAVTGSCRRTVGDAKGLHWRGAAASISLSVNRRPGKGLGLNLQGDLGQVQVLEVHPDSDVALAIEALPASSVGASELKSLLTSTGPSPRTFEVSVVSVNGIPLLSKEQLQFFLDTASENETLKLGFGIELPRPGMDQPVPRTALDDVADFLVGSS
jgi:hypothetical protein